VSAKRSRSINPVPSPSLRSRVNCARGSAFSLLLVLSLASCSWFTDFKDQPKINPWDARSDSGPSRGQPQGSVSIYGSVAPEFAYPRTPQALELMSSLSNPVPADSASVNRGRKQYQINCAACHGPLGKGNGVVIKYGMFPPSIGAGSPADTKWSDGYIFGIIRNGRNLMPSYNRIEEPDRWDIVNYVRSLEGKLAIAADSSHGLPGETGDKLPGVSQMGPTRPAPYYHMLGAQAGAREGLMGSAAPPRADSTAKIPAKPPEKKP
jgi:mono/diheme cytochrome c family protein